jgi:release factor glutamine methyltransferase
VVDNLAKIYLNRLNQQIIEIGCGSGIISLHSINKFPSHNHYAVDINFDALLLTLENMKYNILENLQVICTDFTMPFRIGVKFDTIIFNPPYLPSDENDIYLSKNDKLALIGGKIGIEETMRFVKSQLDRTNRIVIIVSSLATTLLDFSEMIKPWDLKLIEELKIEFEKLWLLLLTLEK